MSRHADTILAAVATDGATSLIATSWRRCATVHRLDPDEVRLPERDPRALREALDRDARLIAIAGPYLGRLFDTLGDPEGSISLVDRHGIMIALRAGRSQDVHERRPERWLGADLGEASTGTNGNGTCLVEERPVVVSGEAHFFSALTHTACVAAPIFAPDGRLIACLNILTDARNPESRRLEAFARIVVSEFARRIELELFAEAFPTARIVMASDAGRHPGALLAIGRDGLVRGATRGARRLLDLDPASLARGVDLDSLRGADSASLAEIERRAVARALAQHQGNVTRAARSLGISRSTFYRKAMPRAADATAGSATTLPE